MAERDGTRDLLDLREEWSSSVLAHLFKTGDRFGMIYIDGSHLFEDVFVDAYFAFRLLEPDGIVAFDDCSTKQVRKVVRFLKRNLAKDLPEIDLSIFSPYPRQVYMTARHLDRVQLRAFRLTGNATRPWNSEMVDFYSIRVGC
jgi:hypothetical protein